MTDTGRPLPAEGTRPSAGGPFERLSLLPPERRSAFLARVRGDERLGDEVLLTAAQRRMWFMGQLTPGRAAYTIPLAYRFRGPVDTAALRRALLALVERHEMLRMRYTEIDGVPVQLPSGEPLRCPVTDLRGAASPEEAAEEVRRRVEEAADEPFRLDGGPLVRAGILLTREATVLVLTLHHSVADGWSLEILFTDLAALYDAEAAGRRAALPAPPYRYARHAAWQRAWLEGPEAAGQIAYWRRQLAGAPELLALPADHADAPGTVGGVGAADGVVGAAAELPVRTAVRLRERGHAEGATPFMVVLAAYSLALHRFTGQDDVLVGSPVSGRHRQEGEGTVGLFVNTVVLRSVRAGAETFAGLLSRTRRTALDAYAHQDVPFDVLVDAMGARRVPGHNPLFQAFLSMEGFTEHPVALGGVPGEEITPPGGGSRFDVDLWVSERLDGSLALRLSLAEEHFEEATARRVLDHVVAVLTAVADHGTALALSGLGAAGRPAALRGAAPSGPPGTTVCDLVARQAERTPDALALAADGERLTYRRLHEEARAFRDRLVALGIGPGDRVGIHLERTARLPVAVLGVLLAGAAYVPLDTALPAERLTWVLEDCGVRLVVTGTDAGRDTFRAAGVRALRVDGSGADGPVSQERGQERGQGQGQGRDGARVGPGDLAYVLYTSGSTGRPKGVAVEHRSVVAMVEWALRTYTAEELAGVLAATPLSFDISVFELFVPLAGGGTVVLADGLGGLSAPPDGAPPITLVNTVPSLLQDHLLEHSLPGSVRTVNLAGEPLPATLARAVHAHGPVRRVVNLRVVNLYGPSEDTVYSTWSEVPPETARPAIGRPVDGCFAYVLDERGGPLPEGAVGELYLGGAGLARGYLDRPSLTAAHFVPDPFTPVPGGRIYRTGDLVRQRPDGELEHLGRADHQIKLHGLRIEPGEIEHALLRSPGVRGAAVTAYGKGPEARLVAYVAGPETLAPRALATALRSRLPAHLVPSQYVVLPALPLTASGKTDRRALPDPGAPVGRPDSPTPRTAEQRLVAEVWGEVLGRDGLRLADDFFVLGGNSLTALRAVGRLNREAGARLAPASLFEAPTVELYAGLLATPGAREAEGPAGATRVTVLREGSGRAPVVCLPPVGGDVLGYAEFATALGAGFPVLGAVAPGLDPVSGPRPLESVPEMADHYLTLLRQEGVDGPAALVGWSMGGVVAVEMAHRLRAAGGVAPPVVLIDSTVPGPEFDVADPLAEFGAHLAAGAGLTEHVHDGKWPDAAALLRWARRRGVLGEETELDRLQARLRVFRAHLAALSRHRVPPHPGPALYLACRDERADERWEPWRPVLGEGLAIREVPGDHHSVMRRPHVWSAARETRAWLNSLHGMESEQRDETPG
ncbi:amino acid adenylation domain-containing protein [Streptomyces sp. JV176]|uniref:non-ribosomal peptide synthetase n=1 Tax=Streptomyces sp. JV176 TaxID=858630 RepID=UPI002E79F738|nr:amino acid adenylation domain-containing protein [Streptomyces sp. JV176]MEE1798414.1 amino acid adenylation domain-containing protein [Streptomyces sp. JV176]